MSTGAKTKVKENKASRSSIIEPSRAISKFPPLSPSRLTLITERNKDIISKQPELVKLQERLLETSGLAVCLVKEPDIEELLARGIVVEMAKPIQIKRGANNQCHANSAKLYINNEKKGIYKLMTGYGLSGDGLWRQHSWVYNPDKKQVIETTTPRIIYFGITLSEEEAIKFFLANCLFG